MFGDMHFFAISLTFDLFNLEIEPRQEKTTFSQGYELYSLKI